MQKTILFIDDDKNMHTLLKHILKHAGYRLQSAFSGGQAIDLLTHETPDLILCDVRMPQQNGYDLLKQIRESEHTAQLPVLVVTTGCSERKKARESGANGCVIKPFLPCDLLAAIQRQLS